jgi:hypothetical protein
VAGLKSAAYLSAAYKENDEGISYEMTSCTLQAHIERSLVNVQARLQRPAIPASPYRRLDTGAIGSLVASYPLRVFEPNDVRVTDTVEYLMKNCLVHGGFFHDMTHSGLNPYLTLHLAQVLLRAGDSRYFALMSEVAALATPTGQWPESIHPRTGGGCMGDGQHVWAAAEWVMMIRNCFVREEDKRLILCSGIPQIWIEKGQPMSFGPAPTSYGDVRVSVTPKGNDVLVEWSGTWFSKEPLVEIRLPGFADVRVEPAANSILLTRMVPS